ncbi:MAG: translation elongation factor Ts [Deltaproteobacteria bacterium]|jgi:elongation factor Ts|nr:translation elongation factor Ts [Deltaproteobacteria bacterium]
MEISSQLVKTLREKTNAPMMNCKKALQECGGDMDKAVDWLRQKGLKLADVRSSRATREGLVLTAVAPDGLKGAMVELNTETDFVAKMDSFKEITESLVNYLIKAESLPSDVPALLECQCPNCGRFFKDVVTDAIAKTGENMKLRRFTVMTAPASGLVHGYIHPGSRLAVLVAVTAEKPGPELDALAHNLAMHIAWANPLALEIADLPPELIEREKAVYAAKAETEAEEKIKKAGAKALPKDVLIGKMIEGQLKKFHGEVVLLEQAYIKDPAKTVTAILKEASGALGVVKIAAYSRFQLGEEIKGEEQ